MSDALPTPAHFSTGFLRKPCPVRRCAELRPLGQIFCERHMAAIPPELEARWIEANRDFVAAAREQEMTAAMQALERALVTERAMRLAIERGEAGDA